MTSQHRLFEEPESAESISSTPAHPVKRSALPASEKVKPIKGIYGLRLSECLKTLQIPSSSPLGSVLKTLLTSWPWSSMIGFPIWQASATPAGRLYFQLRLRVPRTSETESLFWPTPRVHSERSSRKAMVENEHWSAPSLMQVVELSAGILPREFQSEEELNGISRKLWPSPAATNPNEGEPIQPWLDRRQRMKEKHGNGNGFGTPLGIAVRLPWSTPAAQDAKNSTLPPSQAIRDSLPGDVIRASAWPTPRNSDGNGAGQHGDGGMDLRTAAATDQGKLNPAWVEMMMGFPQGWTSLD